MIKSRILITGDSYTKTWDHEPLKSLAFNLNNSTGYISSPGSLNSMKMFFEMVQYYCEEDGIPGAGNAQILDNLISRTRYGVTPHWDFIVIMLTTPMRDLETRAYPEFKDFVLRTDADIHWVNEVSNNYTYSRLKDFAETHKAHILCIGGLDPIDVNIFSAYQSKYLHLVMPWCLSYLAPTLKENVKRNIRWGYLHDCGAVDASSLNIMPDLNPARPNHTHLLYRTQDNWPDIEPYLWPEEGHLNLNAMWKVVDGIVSYIEKNNIC